LTVILFQVQNAILRESEKQNRWIDAKKSYCLSDVLVAIILLKIF